VESKEQVKEGASRCNKKPPASRGLSKFQGCGDCSILQLFAGIDELNAIALMLEGSRRVECPPAAFLTLLLIRRRAYL
jgi:hypothetical protein